MTPDSSTSTLRGRTRFALALSGTILLALIGALLSPLAAQAAVTLRGVVVGPTGTAVASMQVSAISTATDAVVGTATTASNGSFTLASLPTGNYLLKFPATSTTFAQYLGGTSDPASAQVIQLDGGNGDASYIRAALAPAGSIAATVRTTGGTAIASATVTVYSEQAGVWTVVKTALTSSTGAVTFKGLEPGDYRLKAAKGSTYAPIFSGQALSLETATDVAVSASKTSTASFKLGAPAKFSGVVTGGGLPLAGVVVTPWRFVRVDNIFGIDYDIFEKIGKTATTSSSGAYSLTGLTPGVYTVFFSPPAATSYGSNFLGNAGQAADGTRFTLGSGASLTGRNIDLVSGGVVTGTFTGASVARENVRVSLIGWDEEIDNPLTVARIADTDALGQFTFGNVGPGDYKLVYGSFTKAANNPAEDTTWSRRTEQFTLTSNQVFNAYTQNSSLRQPVVTTGTPILAAFSDAYYVGARIETTNDAWQSSGYGATGAYSWYRDGVRIPGAEAYFYIARPGDMGATITARFTRFDFAWGPGGFTTAPSPAIGIGFAPGHTTLPTILGTPKVGNTLTAEPGPWAVDADPGVGYDADLAILWTFQWQRSTNNSTWSDLPGETGKTHVATAADKTSGPYLRVLLHGERYGYQDADYQVLAVQVATNTFSNVTPPTVTKSTTQFTATSPGTWSPSPSDIAFEYEWQVYDADGMAHSYVQPTLLRSVAGTRLVYLNVKAMAAQVTDGNVAILVQKGPAISASGALTISGVQKVGQTLSAVEPVWSPVPGSSTYRWQYYNGTAWKTISGATANTYQVAASLLGKKLRVSVTVAKTDYGTTTRTSAATGAMGLGTALVPTIDPAVSGSVLANRVLTASSGVWNPAATGYTYVWKSRTAADINSPSTAITGATGSTYRIAESLVSKYLSVTVTAKAPGYANGSFVYDVGLVSMGEIRLTTKPTLSKSGTIYTVTKGSWSPTPTSYAYEWIYIQNDGSEGSGPNGPVNFYETATSALHKPVDVIVHTSKLSWLNGQVRIPVKNGDFTLNSPTGVSTLTPRVDELIVGTDPVAYNAPNATTLSYQWQYKTSTGAWASITGATSKDYAPASKYYGKKLRLRVQLAATRYTTFSAYSPEVTVGLGDPAIPDLGDPPTFFSPPRIGAASGINPGTWNVSGLTFTYVWQTAPAGTSTWTTRSTSATYTPPDSLFGSEIQAIVTAKKLGYSPATTTVSPGMTIINGQLANTGKPTVTKSGSTLTVSNGSWNHTPTSYEYAWVRVAPNGDETVVGTDKSYVLAIADMDRYLRVIVTAKRLHYDDGTVSVTGQSGPAIAPTAPITVTGTRIAGHLLTANPTGWNMTAPDVKLQWTRNGVAISGETGPTYLLDPADVGKTVAISITAKATGYPSYSASLGAAVVKSAVLPENLTVPIVSVPVGKEARVGTTFSATPGTWSLPSMTYTYQWYRDLSAIGAATSSTYTAVAADAGRELSVRVTASKSGYQSVTAASGIHSVQDGLAPVSSIASVWYPQMKFDAGPFYLAPPAMTWSPTATISYEWQLTTDNGANWDPISGATAQNFTPPVLALSDYVRLKITATRPGHTTAVIYSQAWSDN